MNDNENQSLGKRRATQFKPGRSGNPRGRPQTKYITAAYERVLSMVVPDEELSGRLAKYKATGITYLEVMALAQAQMAAFVFFEELDHRVLYKVRDIVIAKGLVPLHHVGGYLDSVYMELRYQFLVRDVV
jgi:hypothetical protein